MRCSKCNKHINKSILKSEIICQTCYQYRREGGEWHPLPPKGVVHVTKEGKPICHICGQAHTKLGSHIAHSHEMSVKEYRELFDINSCTPLTTPDYRTLMRRHILNNPECVTYNLLYAGRDTRFTSNDPRVQGRKPSTPVVYQGDTDEE